MHGRSLIFFSFLPIIIFPQNISDERWFLIILDWQVINTCKGLWLTTEIYQIDQSHRCRLVVYDWSTRYIFEVSRKQTFLFSPRTMKEYIYSQKEMFYVNWNKSGLTPRPVPYTVKLFKILDHSSLTTKLIRSKCSTFFLSNLCHLLFTRRTKGEVQSINYGLSDHFKKYM